ncbi:hypothetical protein J921_3801 [Acinetobacter baumannii 25493_8]|nr:hypothetical protein [Acinetobacter baumannii]EYD45338.1 hypothetical protein J917_3988 [Acinetobacter baumannii 25493_4]EYS09839.1 hypothetical protein K013_3928 [Acinetobacter baumannii 25569_7]KCW15430.1 hypothetical protein K035_3921 [Acinetobacter baumannii 42057_4]KCY90705.1 hypothetical protein J729_3043 [Acinetobacter baumannii 929679-598]EIG0125835.1 hypothetical protein [Acinetobacter baumannii]
METKYDWSDAPEEVQFIAQDSNGDIFGFDVPPVPMTYGKWLPANEYLHFFGNKPRKTISDWGLSLEQRPVEKN